jgi:hypothetical protein
MGGGGGGGGGTGFLWQPAAKTKVTKVASDAIVLECCVFKVLLLLAFSRYRYFQLQLGMEFPLPWSRRCCSVPSESMVHISEPPPFSR